MLVSEEKVEGILNYLAESDDNYGCYIKGDFMY